MKDHRLERKTKYNHFNKSKKPLTLWKFYLSYIWINTVIKIYFLLICLGSNLNKTSKSSLKCVHNHQSAFRVYLMRWSGSRFNRKWMFMSLPALVLNFPDIYEQSDCFCGLTVWRITVRSEGEVVTWETSSGPALEEGYSGALGWG